MTQRKTNIRKGVSFRYEHVRREEKSFKQLDEVDEQSDETRMNYFSSK